MFRPTTLMTCLWPGLTRVWWRGEAKSLIPAALFALALNYLLLASFIWSELAPWHLLRWAWCLVGAFWFLGIWQSLSFLPSLEGSDNPASRELFLQAQVEYLQAHWFEAELLLERVLKIDSRDVEARLLLATMYRHTRRLEEAAAELQRLELLERAEIWRLEIEGERRALDRLTAEAAKPATSEPDDAASALAVQAPDATEAAA